MIHNTTRFIATCSFILSSSIDEDVLQMLITLQMKHIIQYNFPFFADIDYSYWEVNILIEDKCQRSRKRHGNNQRDPLLIHQCKPAGVGAGVRDQFFHECNFFNIYYYAGTHNSNRWWMLEIKMLYQCILNDGGWFLCGKVHVCPRVWSVSLVLLSVDAWCWAV